ncbi:MAG: HAMP domain-containing histidine kinase [Alphaproteobacteria bacterium]|nr:HAMP domain-containing histidine kinase [Alphaproteobacteria bacterium]
MPPERLPPTTIDALRGRFDDPSVERAYRDGRFQHDVRDARVVIGSISAVWTALMVFNAASGDVLGASVRLAMLAFAVVVLWRVRDPYDLQRRLVVLQVVFPVVVVGLLAHHGTSSAFVLGWMLSLLFGQSAWAVVPIGPQVLLHAVTCGAFSMLLLQRGEDPVRVLAFVAVCVGPTLALSVLSQTRARRLQAAVWRAEALALEGDRLLASVVHELKTPLAAARMAIGVARANPARTSAMLDRMDARISGLVDLVEALLRFGSLGRGGLQEVEPVDLGALASQVAADVGGLQPEVSVEAVGAGASAGEPQLLKTALTGLAANAVRFAASRVVLTVDGDTVHVDDDGPGVPEERREAVFEPLVGFRGGREHQGLGMGLAIARRIVDAHGGELSVGDAPLGGARFTLRLRTPDGAGSPHPTR